METLGDSPGFWECKGGSLIHGYFISYNKYYSGDLFSTIRDYSYFRYHQDTV